MHLIGTLAAGVNGGEGGHAEIYKRGTATRATYYTDFEGDQQVSSTANIGLDSNGGVAIYVNEIVDVTVKDSVGTTVRSFTEGSAAGDVELRSASFTGTDYETGALAAGNPTTMQAAMDLWLTNSGAVDWKVPLDGADTGLEAPISRLTGLVFNVKETVYGAVGDGIVDDLPAINAAITAAAVSGGLVWFPAGTYVVSGPVDVSGDVTLAGVEGKSLIKGSDDLVVLAMDSSCYVRGLSFSWQTQSAKTADLVTWADGVDAKLWDCTLDATGTTGHAATGAASSTSGSLSLFRTTVTISGATSTWITMGATSTGVSLTIDHCSLTYATAGSWTASAVVVIGDATRSNCIISNSHIDVSAATGGTVYLLSVPNEIFTRVHGNTFVAGGGATVNGFLVGGAIDGATKFFEWGNDWGDPGDIEPCNTLVGGISSSDGEVQGHMQSREGRVREITDNSATVLLDALNYGTITITRTTDTAQTIYPDVAFPGALLTLFVRNKGGGASITFTLSSNVFVGLASFALADNEGEALHFRMGRPTGGVAKWMLIGRTSTYTT